MNLDCRACLIWCAWVVGFLPVGVLAQTADSRYEPTMGQQGKDVVWIPSPPGMVEMMLDMAQVSDRDFVVDLGSGDGRNVIAAAKRGARARGVEYNPKLVELSKRAAVAQGVADKASFVQGDMFEADVSDASVLVLFLVPDNLRKLAPTLFDLKAGTRIVSNTYEIGGGWEPDESASFKPCASWCLAHLYVVPARVAGTWRLPQGVLTLEQAFQTIWGTYEIDGISLPVDGGQLRGDDIHFTINTVVYSGRVSGDSMAGVTRGRASGTWSAKRSDE